MRAVVQRVSRAKVVVEGEEIGAVGAGLAVLLGVGHDDTEADADYVARKVAGLRIFPDDEDKMNRSVLDIGGGVLVVSQFTLFCNVRKGRRPSFVEAAPPERANALYEYFTERLKVEGVKHVATGRFQAMMDVTLTNAGPVTILIDSQRAS